MKRTIEGYSELTPEETTLQAEIEALQGQLEGSLVIKTDNLKQLAEISIKYRALIAKRKPAPVRTVSTAPKRKLPTKKQNSVKAIDDNAEKELNGQKNPVSAAGSDASKDNVKDVNSDALTVGSGASTIVDPALDSNVVESPVGTTVDPVLLTTSETGSNPTPETPETPLELPLRLSQHVRFLKRRVGVGALKEELDGVDVQGRKFTKDELAALDDLIKRVEAVI